MTSPVEAIGSFGASTPIAPVVLSGAGTALNTATNNNETSESAKSFATQLADSLQSLQAVQTRKDELAVKAATGNLNDVHDYTIAATEAALATQLAVAVRDKGVAAFQEIMRMQ